LSWSRTELAALSLLLALAHVAHKALAGGRNDTYVSAKLVSWSYGGGFIVICGVALVSLVGLGRGRYAYDVNAVFVPAALEAIDRLLKSGLLDAYLSVERRTALQKVGAQSKAWSQHAAPPFSTVSAGTAHSASSRPSVPRRLSAAAGYMAGWMMLALI
jgi:hypothetical protein